MKKIIAISKARSTFPKLIDSIKKNNDQVFITVNGKIKAVLISVNYYESLCKATGVTL